VSRRAFSVTEPHSVTDSAVENVDHHVEILRVQSRAASHKARRNREPARQYSAKLDALPVSDNTLQAPWKSRRKLGAASRHLDLKIRHFMSEDLHTCLFASTAGGLADKFR